MFGFNQHNNCFVDSPKYFSPSNLPDNIKKVVTKKLENHKYKAYFKQHIISMYSEEFDQKLWNEFTMYTLRMDEYRRQSIEDLGEYGKLLKSHFKVDKFNK